METTHTQKHIYTQTQKHTNKQDAAKPGAYYCLPLERPLEHRTQDTGHGDIIIISTSSGTRPPSGSQNNEGHPAETTQKQRERARET